MVTQACMEEPQQAPRGNRRYTDAVDLDYTTPHSIGAIRLDLGNEQRSDR